jgi:hypothetical protein
MKSPMAGRNRERKMKTIFNAATLHHRTSRELAGMKDEIQKDLGACAQRARRDQAALAQINRAQAQRRVMRPNL